MIPLFVSWETDDLQIQGPNYAAGTILRGELPLGVAPFAAVTDIQKVVLRNTSHDRQVAVSVPGLTPGRTAESLENVSFFLSGTDPVTVAALLNEWPLAGCGVELSMDSGVSWQLFSGINTTLPDGRVIVRCGVENDPSTWVGLKGIAVAAGAADGELLAYAPFDRAYLMMRARMPAVSSLTGLIRYQLGLSFDVL
jgi:hypothetical protein